MRRSRLHRSEWLAVVALGALGGCEVGNDGGASVAPERERGESAARDAGAAAASRLGGGAWRLVAIRQAGSAAERLVGAEPRYTIEFGADARFFGIANCNRYSGGYREPEAGRLEFSAAAATRMACPEPSIEYEFLRALGGDARYELDGNRLKISYGADGLLTFERDAAPAAAAPGAAAPVAASESAAAAAEVGRTFVYDCDGDVSFTVRTGPGEVALWAPQSLGGRYTVLGMTPAASGARYAEGDTVYWNRGNVATFELDGRRFVDCPSNPRKVPWADAARRGVTFRALGNEPAWSLEISADRLALITDLGESRTELAYAPPTSAGTTTTYRASGDGLELVAVVDRAACADSMSGEAFEATVTITFDGRMVRGCGRFL